MTDTTYEAMHIASQAAGLLDLERDWSERLGAAGAHKLMCRLLDINGNHDLRRRFLDEADELSYNVIQGPW